MIAQVDNMTRTVQLLRNPDGSQQFPSRSCCDLREQYPNKPSGTYWIDPNGGHPADAFTVYCNFDEGEKCSTCIDMQNKWSALKEVEVSSESYWSLSNLYGQFASVINKVQLKMLQVTSRSAEQLLTIRCQKVELASKKPSFRGFNRKGLAVPEPLSDTCKTAGGSDGATVFSFSSSPMALPVVDVDLWLGRQEGEAIGLELGPVCFSR